MDYQVSARKYRPGTFDDVIGQPHVVQTLVNSITTKRIAQAYLFSGTRGVGKTTVARILAKALNCEQGPTGTPCGTCSNCLEIAQGTSVDVMEIDGASNTSVDDVREIRENVKFAAFRGKYRVYIIDEVHMLSNSAFNALLKTLEEPPPHVVFIFATTEIHKIPATILSRCQHYNFRRIARTEIVERLRHVVDQDRIVIEERSLMALARASEGSMRDGLSLLDQAVAFGGKTIVHTDLEALLGAVPQELVRAMIQAITAQESAAALRVLAQLLDQGHDLRAYCAEVVEYLRNMLVVSVVTSPQEWQGLIEASAEDLAQMAADAGLVLARDASGAVCDFHASGGFAEAQRASSVRAGNGRGACDAIAASVQMGSQSHRLSQPRRHARLSRLQVAQSESVSAGSSADLQRLLTITILRKRTASHRRSDPVEVFCCRECGVSTGPLTNPPNVRSTGAAGEACRLRRAVYRRRPTMTDGLR